ncbi:MAG: NAD(P)/FAD-dependent oxidoreductase [candidate division Zixibacteria bacterium]|nr:NAD(P)/FAD-dependent oxidoreductase [candidate division Zixibacteria bacterium]MCI0595665.1 NAD(P)/FAD-dependent oxidoreductase [candidate division Zixibacteria bacterium]
MSSGNHYDVIVVGAGPGGSSAARAAAKKGRKVLLLEKHPIVGYPLCCAEGISKSGLEGIVPLNPRWVASRVERVLLVGPGGAEARIEHPAAGYVLDRKIFDRDLAGLAAREGATVKAGTPVVGLLNGEGGPIRGVKVLEKGKPNEYYAPVIIASDGIESRIGFWAGLNTTLYLSGFDSAAQYLLGGLDVDEECLQFYFGRDLCPGGYGWVFPKGGGTANVGLAFTPALNAKVKAIELLNKFVAERFPRVSVIETIVGGVPAYVGKKLLRIKNVLLVGDAARLVDSISGAGIANALLSGKIAGETAAEYLPSKHSLDFLERYRREWDKVKGREMRFYLYIRQIYVRMSDSEFDNVIRFVRPLFENNPVRAIEPIGLLKRVLRENPKLLLLARHIRW